ncbi:hypothetical protein [endosymbiont GvMRE of Glomus versiforme]|uniref:hypothetical protein n=1 Tax=endosymbiont GvMRE of Glomus versiforme TaxID=2039283 RepID=UPI000EBA5849|nr:hypothetical protein [endosymbiont GvMRE of Glomus versiforme]RHZ36862.1 hypothetical protein GvMRE_I2g58 [endosymbiont GvMRE of Glomus versiforme]
MKLNIDGNLAMAYEEEATGENFCANCAKKIEDYWKELIVFDKNGNRIGFLCFPCAASLETELTDEEWDKAWFGKEE